MSESGDSALRCDICSTSVPAFLEDMVAGSPEPKPHLRKTGHSLAKLMSTCFRIIAHDKDTPPVRYFAYHVRGGLSSIYCGLSKKNRNI